MSPVLRYSLALAIAAAVLRLEYEFISQILTNRVCHNGVCEMDLATIVPNVLLALLVSYGFLVAWRIGKGTLQLKPVASAAPGDNLLSGVALILAGILLAMVGGFLAIIGWGEVKDGMVDGWSLGFAISGALIVLLALAAWRLAWQRRRRKT